ncbi:MAG: nucleotidyltransferase domain-containing protein [Pseudomonadota bacterium]|nr:nucleotidyltransferase domain-containing protein [Pseudomonadota bacterium]
MRLTEAQRQAITDTLHGADTDAPVFLFGSHIDDRAKGGDIDLLVISSQIDLMAELDILARLHRQIGDRQNDLVIQTDPSRSFGRLAVKGGVRL